jgi:transposase
MKRRRFSSEFKAKVVLEVLQERLTAQEIAAKHKIHPQQITGWKSQFLAGASGVFEKGSGSVKDEGEAERDRLLRLIGEQKVEIDFLKKKL